jgi:beta-lactamase regulating signal transducer with metallopeptidase domain
MRFFDQSLLLHGLGWSLIDSFWQMGFLWFLYIFLIGKGNRFSAASRHNLAVMLSSIGFFWFCATFVWHLTGLSGSSPLNYLVALWSPGNKLLSLVNQAKSYINEYSIYLSVVYLFAIGIISLRYLRYFAHLKKLKLSGLRKVPSELGLFVSDITIRMGISRKVAVFLSSVVDSPLTVGFLKPIILVPVATINHLSLEQVETILLHELSHIKRWDYLINLFIIFSGIVLFFNPFLKLFIQAIKRERELCCDDQVLQFQYSPKTYATALLSLEICRHRGQELAMAATGKDNRLLLQRVQRLTGQKISPAKTDSWTLFFIVPAVIAGCLALIRPMHHVSGLGRELFAAAHQFRSGRGTSRLMRKDPPAKSIHAISKTKKQTPSVLASRDAVYSTSDLEDAKSVAPSDDFVSSPQEDDSPSPKAEASLETYPGTQEESQDFSIVSDPISPALPSAVPSNYPYVANSSFVIYLTEDSSKSGSSEQIKATRIFVPESVQNATTAANKVKNKRSETENEDPSQAPSLENSKIKVTGWTNEFDEQKMYLCLNLARQEKNQRSQPRLGKLIEVRNLQKQRYVVSPETRKTLLKIGMDSQSFRELRGRMQTESIQQTEKQLRKKSKVVYI